MFGSDKTSFHLVKHFCNEAIVSGELTTSMIRLPPSPSPYLPTSKVMVSEFQVKEQSPFEGLLLKLPESATVIGTGASGWKVNRHFSEENFKVRNGSYSAE